MEFYFNNRFFFKTDDINCLNDKLFELGFFKTTDYYLLFNGKRISPFEISASTPRIHIIPTLCAGKGGFGSMLRAIGAQIEKTTNREACRDLSGRRLRDINEEQRLKNWIAQQAEREKEAAKKKQKKLEKLCEKPRHEFKDESYDQLRAELPEKVEDAVEQGLKASASSATKRKHEPTSTTSKNKKKAKLWFDEEELSCSDSDDASGDEKTSEKVESSDDSSGVDKKSVVVEEKSVKLQVAAN